MNSCEVNQKSSGRLAADAVAAVLGSNRFPDHRRAMAGMHGRPPRRRPAAGMPGNTSRPPAPGCALSAAGTQRADTPNQEGATARCVHESKKNRTAGIRRSHWHVKSRPPQSAGATRRRRSGCEPSAATGMAAADTRANGAGEKGHAARALHAGRAHGNKRRAPQGRAGARMEWRRPSGAIGLQRRSRSRQEQAPARARVAQPRLRGRNPPGHAGRRCAPAAAPRAAG